MPEMVVVNDTTYEATLLGGDTVAIGDKESADFKPHIKLNRWDGECFIKVGLATTEKPKPVVEGGKVKFEGKDIEAHFYPLEPRTVIAKDRDGNDVPFTQNELGGFEFEVILKKKPVSNKIVLNIETQGLKFYYQPELSPEEIADGAIRPDNVIGSYAVYHATRTNMHRGKADAEKYKCGKAFHIYRPKITDAEGKWVWGKLSLDEQVGSLTTTIPQDFLDGAVYPVSTGTSNFGYEDPGGTNISLGRDGLRGSMFSSPADAASGVSLTFYSYKVYGTGNAKGVIVLHSSLEILTNGIGDPIALGGADWYTSSFSSAPSLSPSTEYVLMFIHDCLYGAGYYYDAGDTDQGHIDSSNSYTSPTDPTDATHNENKYSIYCTYEEEAAEGWFKIAYTSEPPTPNAWNQVKQDAGTGWKKILYEGE